MPDLRPDRDAELSILGSSATVTPDGPATAIQTTVVWLPMKRRKATDEIYEVHDFQRRDRVQKLIAIPLADVPDVPVGTLVQAAEYPTNPPTSWRVDAIEEVDAEYTRVVIVPR